jgi:hypothetical protein
MQLCENCVTDITANSITTDKHITLAAGEQVMLSGRVRRELAFTVHTAIADAKGAITVSKGAMTGSPLEVSRLRVQPLPQIYTNTDYCLVAFCTWIPTTRSRRPHQSATTRTLGRSCRHPHD